MVLANIEPTRLDEGRYQPVGAAGPADEFGDSPVVEPPDVSLWRKLGGGVPEQFEDASRHRSRDFQQFHELGKLWISVCPVLHVFWSGPRTCSKTLAIAFITSAATCGTMLVVFFQQFASPSHIQANNICFAFAYDGKPETVCRKRHSS